MARAIHSFATGLLLLLSSAPFLVARGSFVFDGDQVISDRVHEAIRVHVGKVQEQTRKRSDLLHPSAAAIASGRPVRYEIYPNVLADSLRSVSEKVQASNIDGRTLQESACADVTSSISVTSTVFLLLEGCLAPTLVEGVVWYESETAIIAPIEGTTSTDPKRWYAFYANASAEYVQACASLESPDDVDPSEATWYCDADGDGLDYTLADDELVVSCGCSVVSPSPFSVASSPSPVVANPQPSPLTPTCGEGDSFTIASGDFPETEGCFLDTTTISNDNVVYTPSGTSDFGQVFVAATEVTAEDGTSSVPWVIFYLGTSTSTGSTEIYCISVAEAALYHPADVPDWACDFVGDKTAFTIVDGVLDVSCGCSIASPSPIAVEISPSPVIPEPELSPTAPACDDGDSFSVESSTFLDAEGCFVSTEQVINDFLVYTPSGTTDVGQVGVYAAALTDDDSSSMVWVVANVVSSDDIEVYCISVAEAFLYHPSDVPVWQCDTDGDGVRETLEDILFVTCGCTTTPTPELSTTPAPLPVTALTPAPLTSSGTCREGVSFSVSSVDLPGTEGCYLSTSAGLNGELVYTTSGTTDGGQTWMAALEVAGDDDSDSVLHWVLADVSSTTSSTGDATFYCFSSVQATLYHPAEVPEWACEAGATISVDCGCSGSPSPVTGSPVPSPISRVVPTTAPSATVQTTSSSSPPTAEPTLSLMSPRTPAPVTASSTTGVSGDDDGDEDDGITTTDVANTCTGDGSFTITANAAPALSGCYLDTGVTAADADRTVAYTVSGTTTVTEIYVISIANDDTGDFKWYILDVPVDEDSSEEGKVYCESEESASAVNPGNASWNCDFIGNKNFSQATDDDLSITCGSCDERVVAEDRNAASKVLISGVMAGSACIIAAVSACGCW